MQILKLERVVTDCSKAEAKKLREALGNDVTNGVLKGSYQRVAKQVNSR